MDDFFQVIFHDTLEPGSEWLDLTPLYLGDVPPGFGTPDFYVTVENQDNPTDKLLQLSVVLGLTGLSFVAISTWTLFGSIIKRYLYQPRARLTLNIILALFLVYTALELARIL